MYLSSIFTNLVSEVADTSTIMDSLTPGSSVCVVNLAISVSNKDDKYEQLKKQISKVSERNRYARRQILQRNQILFKSTFKLITFLQVSMIS